MEQQQTGKQLPEVSDLLAEPIQNSLPEIPYTLDKSLIYPRSISYAISSNPAQQAIDIELLSDALRFVRQSCGLTLTHGELESLIEIVSERKGTAFGEGELAGFADRTSLTQTSYFKIGPDGCLSKLRSQINLNQAETPVFTDFALELTTIDSPAGKQTELVFRISWHERQDEAGALAAIGWNLADPILFALANKPLPDEVRGEDISSVDYTVRLTDKVFLGVSYRQEPESSKRISQEVFMVPPGTLQALLQTAIPDEEIVAETSLTRTGVLVRSLEVLDPKSNELKDALSSIGISIPLELVEHLLETAREMTLLDNELISQFTVQTEPVRISQSTYLEVLDDALLEDQQGEDQEEEEDEDEDEEDDYDDDDDDEQDRIEIALADKSKQDTVTVSFALSDEFSDIQPNLIVKIKFDSVSNCLAQERMADRWRMTEEFILACNGPRVPEQLNQLLLVERWSESDSMQIDDDGRFFLTPEIYG